MWELGLLVFAIGSLVFIIGIYWMRSSRGKKYHSGQVDHVAKAELLRKHERMKDQAMIEDARRKMRGWRRR